MVNLDKNMNNNFVTKATYGGLIPCQKVVGCLINVVSYEKSLSFAKVIGH